MRGEPGFCHDSPASEERYGASRPGDELSPEPPSPAAPSPPLGPCPCGLPRPRRRPRPRRPGRGPREPPPADPGPRCRTDSQQAASTASSASIPSSVASRKRSSTADSALSSCRIKAWACPRDGIVPHSFGVTRLPHGFRRTMNWPCFAGWMKYSDLLSPRWRRPPRAAGRACASKCFDASMSRRARIHEGPSDQLTRRARAGFAKLS
jgi:hypothetical protein